MHDGKEHDEDKKKKMAMADESTVNAIIEQLISKMQELLTPMQDENVELKAKSVELSKKIEAIEKANIEFAKEKEALSLQVVELSKQPATASIKQAPVQLEYSKMSNVQKMEYNMKNSRV